MHKLFILTPAACALLVVAASCQRRDDAFAGDAGSAVERMRAAERTEADRGNGFLGIGTAPLAEQLADQADKVNDLADDLNGEADDLIKLADEARPDADDVMQQAKKVAKLSDELDIEVQKLDVIQAEYEKLAPQ